MLKLGAEQLTSVVSTETWTSMCGPGYGCYSNYYNYLTPTELASKCPKCLDTCVCRKCMRAGAPPFYVSPPFSADISPRSQSLSVHR